MDGGKKGNGMKCEWMNEQTMNECVNGKQEAACECVNNKLHEQNK